MTIEQKILDILCEDLDNKEYMTEVFFELKKADKHPVIDRRYYAVARRALGKTQMPADVYSKIVIKRVDDMSQYFSIEELPEKLAEVAKEIRLEVCK